MSPSRTGPGSWTPASTLEGRETSWERMCPGLDVVAGVLVQALRRRARPERGRRQADLSGSERAAFDWGRPRERLRRQYGSYGVLR